MLGKPREPCGACETRDIATPRWPVRRRGFVVNGGCIDVGCAAYGWHIGAARAVNGRYIDV